MIRKALKNLFGIKDQIQEENKESKGLFSTHAMDHQSGYERKITAAQRINDAMLTLWNKRPKQEVIAGQAMDDSESGDFSLKSGYSMSQPAISEALMMWYISQSFIGYQMCAFLAQHWLIDKACTIPSRDAIRQGYDIVSSDENALDTETMQKIQRLNQSYKLNENLMEFIRFGRIFGIRILLFKVESSDPKYYEKPFNIDGIQPGSYKGMVQVDPYWTAPWLDGESASQTNSMHFYEPTWWVINGIKYHRSHLIIFKGTEVADFLKPAYLYGGVPVPQKIMERVYAAERTANEAPLLAMTKRMTVFKTNIESAFQNKETFDQNMMQWIALRDNQQIKLADREDDISQLDTSLTDLDTVIMTQYQIVAAAANVPATKMLGTTPKGFNATGEYEEASYHEELESIQTHDLTPIMDRHHAILCKSENLSVSVKIEWNPVDSPTAAEEAEINNKKANTIQTLVNSGSIDGYDGHEFLVQDKSSGFTFMESIERPDDVPEDFTSKGKQEGDGGFGQDADEYDFDQIRRGFKVEQEHIKTVGGDEDKIIDIVIDHLAEDPQYYAQLAKVEKD